MKRETTAWLLSLFLACTSGFFTGCNSNDTPEATGGEPLSPLLLTGIVPSIEGSLSATTRAAATDSDYVGRSAFVNEDKLTFTTIQRTLYPAPEFTYKNMVWSLQSSLWSSETAQDIYWSDAASDHTFVGYGLPKDFTHWKQTTKEGKDIYYGCLGDPDATDELDFTTTFQTDAETGEYKTDTYGNPLPEEGKDGADKLKKEDVVLTYRTDMTASEGGSKALIHFRHALSQVRIEVYIGNFSAGVEAKDNEAVVSKLVVKDQPVLYKWKENDAEYQDGAKPLEESDVVPFDGVAWDKKRDVKPWIRKPQGEGKGVDKKYIYRMLAVPGTRTEDMVFTFKVTYPDPLDLEQTLTANYKATLKGGLTLHPGKTTLIKIELNHLDSEPTVGAEYVDWVFTPTPDRGELSKNDTFLDSNKPESVVLSGEAETADAATWLYHNGTDLVDQLGNDGTISAPYKITTAAQLLAFAYEVNEGMTFEEKYIRLDASLVLQPIDTYTDAVNDKTLVWPGIGTETNPFKGVFFGGQGSISHLYGHPLFGYVDEKGWLEQVTLTDVKGIKSESESGRGILADVNNGLLCACRVEGDITSSLEKVGGLTGINNGAIVFCVHIGNVTGVDYVGGLAGTNSGFIAASLQAGDVKTTATPTEGFTPKTAGIANNVTGGISTISTASCYYDSSLCTPTETDGSEGIPTTQMQSESFVTELNTYIWTEDHWTEFLEYMGDAYKQHTSYGQNHKYLYSPLQYPRIINTGTSTTTGGGEDPEP